MAKDTKYNSLLEPETSTVVLIDHQPQLDGGRSAGDGHRIVKKVAALAQGATILKVPVILTSTVSNSPTEDIWPPLRKSLPHTEIIKRSAMNPWEHEAFVNAVEETRRRRLILAGLWTEGALSFAALSALEEGYSVYVAKDASAGGSAEDHETALDRMMQAGAVLLTVRQILLEWQRCSVDPVALNELLALPDQP